MKPLTIFKNLVAAVLLGALSVNALAADAYKFDTKGAHAFIQFKIKHLGYSWLYGRFDKFEGVLMLDEKSPADSNVKVTVDVASLNSNHAERDKHLKGKDFLDVKKFPTAEFVSTKIELTGEGSGNIIGNMTIHGVTKEVSIPMTYVGGGNDPWGGLRHGFTGAVTLKLKDFGIDYDLGPASTEVELLLDIEVIKQ